MRSDKAHVNSIDLVSDRASNNIYYKINGKPLIYERKFAFVGVKLIFLEGSFHNSPIIVCDC